MCFKDRMVIVVVAVIVGLFPVAGLAQVTVVEGETGPGALYGFYVPDNWNGDVVFYAHGLTSPNDPVSLDPNGNISDFKDPLLLRGYAFAMSSFSENGYAVKRGAQQTHQLRGLFKSYFGNPRRAYLVGYSMGGGIVITLAEAYPEQYDGALAMCGIVGGSAHQMNHLFNFRVLFDYFYPGLIPGDPLSLPEGTDFWTDIFPRVFVAMGDPASAMELVGVDQLEIEVINPATELLGALGFNFFSYTAWALDFPDRVNGHAFFDNSGIVYTGSLDDTALNAGVERFGPASPKAVNYLKHHFLPGGQLEIPIVTLHNSRDQLVPISHEEIYASAVASSGASDMLLQRTVDSFGHCSFSEDDWLSAFMELVEWVETGIKPAP